MKKLYLTLGFLALFGFLAFAADGEELDFLLFAPNSATAFANPAQARLQLDNLARYLTGRNLFPRQIQVHGYAAAAKNDIEPVELSRARAFHVMMELQRRGVPLYLFADPVSHGEVNLWGTAEGGGNLNRRVRIALDGGFLSPALTAAKPAPAETAFPWLLLILTLLLFGIALFMTHFLLLSKRRAPTAVDQCAVIVREETPHAKTGKNTEMEKTLREIILRVPAGAYFDVHTIVEILLQDHDDVYLSNVGHYRSAAQYHARISTIIGRHAEIVEKAGDSHSKNIHKKFSECHLFRRIAS